MTIPHKYDSKTCVCAGTLREQGFSLPERIPDRAWIPNGSWIFIGPVDVKVDEKDNKMFHFSMGELVYNQPFRWDDIITYFVVGKQTAAYLSIGKEVQND